MNASQITKLADIDLKMENKELKSADEFNKAKLVVEGEIANIDNEIKKLIETRDNYWPERIQFVKRYAEKEI